MLEIPVNAFAAALTHAAVKDVRYYLKGVYLDCPRGRIVATDGHRLFCGQIPVSADQPVIVPRDAVEMLVKARKQVPVRARAGTLAAVSFSCDPKGAGRQVTLAILSTGFSLTVDPVDGAFPEYERVIPAETSGESAQYRPEYLVDASNALAIYGGRDRKKTSAHVEQNGTGAALATWQGINAFSVVMPMRASVPGDLDWYK